MVPLPPSQPPSAPEPAPLIRQLTRADVIWNRPVFKAPPLKLSLTIQEMRAFADELRQIGQAGR